MIGRLMIPVAGTVAALIAIAFAREPRGNPAPETPPFQWPTKMQDHSEPLPTETLPPAEEEAPPKATPQPQEFLLELGADGTILDVDGKRTFKSIEELQEKLGDARHRLVVTNGKDVPEATLDAVFTTLRDAKLASGDPRFQVRKVYRAPEAPAGD